MRVPKRDPIRDNMLITDYKEGKPIHKLNGKYGISSSRIYQILNFYKIEKRSRKK